jgi:hypothetical protein
VFQKSDTIVFKKFGGEIDLSIVYSLLNFLSNIIFSIIILIIENKGIKSSSEQRQNKLKSQNENGFNDNEINDLVSKDSSIKIIILIFLAAFFDFAANIDTKIFTLFVNSAILKEMNIRSLEICFSALLSYIFLRIQFNRHHIVSLGIIILFIITFLTYQLIENCSRERIFFILLVAYLQICKVLNDIIQKYLMESAYFNPYKLLLIQGVFELILSSPMMLLRVPRVEVKSLLESIENQNMGLYIFLLIMYFIISGIKNIYEILTLKVYWPTTIALAESIKDPFLNIMQLITTKDPKNPFLWFSLIVSVITVFFSLVYNEFLILKCCNLGYNTHVEINEREKINGLLLEVGRITLD